MIFSKNEVNDLSIEVFKKLVWYMTNSDNPPEGGGEYVYKSLAVYFFCNDYYIDIGFTNVSLSSYFHNKAVECSKRVLTL